MLVTWTCHAHNWGSMAAVISNQQYVMKMIKKLSSLIYIINKIHLLNCINIILSIVHRQFLILQLHACVNTTMLVQ